MSKRRWLRPTPRISYFEPEEPELDEYIFCEKCGDFVYEYCSIHGALLVIPDDKVPAKHNFPSFVPRAALTIPKVFLHLNYSTIPGAGLGVFATLTLPKGVRFGPYRGVNTKEITSDYSWQIYGPERRPSHAVDAADGARSNWMRFVNCARRWREQNLLAFQYRGLLYYRTIRIVPRFTELMVFYGSEFAKKLRIDLGKYNAPKSYAQKFGACVIKKPKVIESQKSQNEKNIVAKGKENDIQPKVNETVTPNVPENKCTKKRTGENQLETRKDAPAAKKRKTKVENKKLHPETLGTNKTTPEEIKERARKPDENVARDQKNEESNIKTANDNKKDSNIANNVDQNNNKNQQNTKNVDTNLTESVDNDVMINGIEKDTNTQRKPDETQKKERNVVLKEMQNIYVKCNECNYQSYTKELLATHIRFHDVNRKFVCETCGYRFSLSTHLNSHKLIHDTKCYKCGICDYKCKVAGSLKTHLRIHTGEKPYKCGICDYKCKEAGSLKRHLRVHTGEKPYKCGICDYKCKVAGSLKNHLRVHTGEKPYKCGICDYKCKVAGSLKNHLRVHTGEKPYKCGICDYKCKVAGSLKNHLRVHTGEKPYKCGICDYKCKEAGHLKRHLRVHTGDKAYSCDICDYKCNKKNDLNNHLKMKHLS